MIKKTKKAEKRKEKQKSQLRKLTLYSMYLINFYVCVCVYLFIYLKAFTGAG